MADNSGVNFFDAIINKDIERLMGVYNQGISCLEDEEMDDDKLKKEVDDFLDLPRDEVVEGSEVNSVTNADTMIESSKNNLTCTCGKTFTKRYNLKRHQRIHTGEGYVTCEICKEEFFDSYKLNRHKEEVHNGTHYLCTECDASFSRKYLLTQHSKTHSGNASFLCQFCGKGYYDRLCFEAHLNQHTGSTPYKCDKCKKAFTVQCRLKRHQKTCHMNDKKYVCVECGRHFKAARYLKEHMNCHTQDRNYQCDTCGEVFYFRQTLKKHKLKH